MSRSSSPIDSSSTTSKKTKPAAQRRKHHHHHHHQGHGGYQPLLPGLPDHIAQTCLSLVDPHTLYSVCRSWRRLIYSPSFPPFLSIYALLLPTATTVQQQQPPSDSDSVRFSCFDPVSTKWVPLPSPPPDPPLRFLLCHPSFISRRLPVQSVSVNGKLILLAATADHFQPALNRPLIFCPLSQRWSYGPPFATPRRWCAAGSSAGTVYVSSGVGSHYSQDIARSVEKWDLLTSISSNPGSPAATCESDGGWKWEKMDGLMKDGKFSRDAIDAVGWRGKLCMVNVKGDAAKEGIMYDVKNDTWGEMPAGMLLGWRGPATSMDEETIYVVNESKGVLRRYDPGKDIWVDVYESKMLQGAQYVAAAGGRVCIVVGAGRIVVVDVTVLPSRAWTVNPPPGFQPVSIHLLPRMTSQQEEEFA
ncbi:OLC1v1033973C1 [Oldenlandia corymbosa var. corymbosa]|uniref:OLC1v1033973C1 n=1 Tax=Oldenlandia corymbosa var. corymbosa TaxID=529605 RepID=A0AAV1CPM3_OLDCO|nr:OLC1v1033973C1 [Oldenlandia corymbosa var. corymbosa]